LAKILVALVLIAGAAYFIYTRVGRTTSEEEVLVANLHERYNVVVNKFLGAIGRSGAIGLDTTFDAETAANQVLKIRAELAQLRPRLTEATAIRKAAALAAKIEAFCEKNKIIGP
jgi:hypothetical protein